MVLIKVNINNIISNHNRCHSQMGGQWFSLKSPKIVLYNYLSHKYNLKFKIIYVYVCTVYK